MDKDSELLSLKRSQQARVKASGCLCLDIVMFRRSLSYNPISKIQKESIGLRYSIQGKCSNYMTLVQMRTEENGLVLLDFQEKNSFNIIDLIV